MTTLSDFLLVDGTDYPLAAYFMKLIAATLRAEYRNVESITGAKQLTDNDTPFQLITASGANRDVKLAAEATTNHVTVIYNNGGSNNVVVKDDSGATTFATLGPGAWCLALPMGGVVWKVVDSSVLTSISAASDTVAGIVELATAAETTTGTDAARAVTPDALAGSIFGIKTIPVEVFGPATTLTTGDGKRYVPIPASLAGFNIIRVHVILIEPSTSGTPTFQVARGRRASPSSAPTFADVLTTVATVDANEYDSRNASTQPVVNGANDDLADGDLLRIDCDVAGTGAKGCYMTIEAQKP